jgi:hypothetical protein
VPTAHNFVTFRQIILAAKEVADANLTSGKQRLPVEEQSYISLRSQKRDKSEREMNSASQQPF